MTKFHTNMMRTAALLLCSASLALPAMAQGGQTNDGPPPPGQGPGGMRGGMRIEMLQSELSLTPEQTVKVKAILEDSRAKMMAARQAGDGREKMMEIRRTQNEKIKDVLDEGQKKKFEEMQAKMRDRMRQGPPAGDTPPPPPPPQQ